MTVANTKRKIFSSFSYSGPDDSLLPTLTDWLLEALHNISLFPTLEWLFEASKLSLYCPVVLSSLDFFLRPWGLKSTFTLPCPARTSSYSVVFSREICPLA